MILTQIYKNLSKLKCKWNNKIQYTIEYNLNYINYQYREK